MTILNVAYQPLTVIFVFVNRKIYIWPPENRIPKIHSLCHIAGRFLHLAKQFGLRIVSTIQLRLVLYLICKFG